MEISTFFNVQTFFKQPIAILMYILFTYYSCTLKFYETLKGIKESIVSKVFCKKFFNSDCH